MRNRKVVMVNEETLDPSGTRIFNLDFSNPIVALLILIQGVRYDNSDTASPVIQREISKIEVVDGSDVLFSMTMEEAMAMQFYTTGQMPFQLCLQSTYAECEAQAIIRFGRDDSDQQWMLDTKKFVNPQLKITYAFTEAAGYWKADRQKLSVTAVICESPVRDPEGFLMGKQIYTWAKAASGDETIDLPRDYLYRMLILRCKDSLTPTWNEFTNLKISCDMDRFVPVNERIEDISRCNMAKLGLCWYQNTAVGDGADTDIKSYNPFAWNFGGNVECWNSGDLVVHKRPYSGYMTVARASGTALTAGQRAISTHQGFNYNWTEAFLFGNLADQEEFFDPMSFKSVRAIITQGGGAAYISALVLQQLRNYL